MALSNIFQMASDALADTLLAVATVEVTYRRDNISAVVPAVVGTTEFEYADANGAIVVERSRDFLIKKENLLLEGVAIEPREGDEIVESVVVDDAGVTTEHATYEVNAPGDAPAWRWSDRFFTTYRIHTKRID